MQTLEEKEEIRAIPEKVLKTLTIQGYFERFYELLPECNTNRQAYERLEQERQEIGLSERYSSYESFRVAKWYHNAGRC